MNLKEFNAVFEYLSNFKNIFVPYSPGDSGGAIGACLSNLSNKHKFEIV